MDIFAKEFRADMLRQIDWLIDAKDKSASEVAVEAAKLRSEYEQLVKTKSRLTNEECPVSVCPNCFYMRHTSSTLRAVTSSSKYVDKFECKSCGHEWEKPE